MKIEQVPKTMEYVLAHIQDEELVFLLYDDHILHYEDTKVKIGRFSSKVVKVLSYNSIKSYLENNKTILVKITLIETES